MEAHGTMECSWHQPIPRPLPQGEREDISFRRRLILMPMGLDPAIPAALIPGRGEIDVRHEALPPSWRRSPRLLTRGSSGHPHHTEIAKVAVTRDFGSATDGRDEPGHELIIKTSGTRYQNVMAGLDPAILLPPASTLGHHYPKQIAQPNRAAFSQPHRRPA